MPGTAVTVGDDGRWYRARSVYVTEEQAETAAELHAQMAPSWAEMTTATVGPVTDDELDRFIPDPESERV